MYKFHVQYIEFRLKNKLSTGVTLSHDKRMIKFSCTEKKKSKAYTQKRQRQQRNVQNKSVRQTLNIAIYFKLYLGFEKLIVFWGWWQRASGSIFFFLIV